ncbi:helix-turn-helix domain-containing protein [Kineococcus rubinsiae]|uniref:helix-turn-helix domain-containing protein n=1 Tax=Kineococcus rubinsiae TaxID=2609562 RepID=UPI00142FFD06|nr:helix-turn-helix domain-containing protein [Kineococcus rubinsiae]NIZ89666.1 helix-turn-helix domain-containing protein [Kineococcus rubinsiae]
MNTPPIHVPADRQAPTSTDFHPTDATNPGDHPSQADDISLVVEEPRFALVPEWVIDAPIPDSSFRLYSLLLRYGGTSGHRMPSRTTLARRMHRSVDAVDRAMRELVTAGIVRVEHRRNGQQYLSNRYHVRTSAPFPEAGQAAQVGSSAGGRTSAATPVQAPTGGGGGRTDAATASRTGAATRGRGSAATPGRTDAGRVAADVRHDPELLTQSTPPPPSSSSAPPRAQRPAAPRRVEEVDAELMSQCQVDDLGALAARCAAARRSLGLSATRWAPRCVAAALHLAVRGRGWPAELAAAALVAVAADPASQSPMRLAEAGPWWDQVSATDSQASGGQVSPMELAELEQRLAELGGQRVGLQATARAQLAHEGMPVTRATVLRRACELLDGRAAG